VIAQFAFALYRPIAVSAHGNGTYYGRPYPGQFGRLKSAFAWDIERYRGALARCRPIKVDVDDAFLERVTQNVLINQGLRWFADRPQNTYYGNGRDVGLVARPAGEREDCVITTATSVEPTPSTVVWLRRTKK